MGKPEILPKNNPIAAEKGAPGLDGLTPGENPPSVAQVPEDTPPEHDPLANLPQIPVENYAPLPDDDEGNPAASILDQLFGGIA